MGASVNNFSTQAFEEGFLERALSILTGTLVVNNEGSEGSNSDKTSTKSKNTEDNDEPCASGLQNFQFPAFRNPFIAKNSESKQ